MVVHQEAQAEEALVEGALVEEVQVEEEEEEVQEVEGARVETASHRAVSVATRPSHVCARRQSRIVLQTKMYGRRGQRATMANGVSHAAREE